MHKLVTIEVVGRFKVMREETARTDRSHRESSRVVQQCNYEWRASDAA